MTKLKTFIILHLVIYVKKDKWNGSLVKDKKELIRRVEKNQSYRNVRPNTIYFTLPLGIYFKSPSSYHHHPFS